MSRANTPSITTRAILGRAKPSTSPAFKDRVRQSRAPFPDQRFTIRALIGERDKMVATWLWQGTHAGDVPGFPASGKHVTMSGVTVYSFEGAKLSGHWQVADRLSIFRQLSGQPG